ncbi:MAG: toll/interleukin-1 receptor domain-containing protein [Candidatus Aphodosoma sp.]
MKESDYKYFAFISYNSHDTSWGKRLQRKLESYRMPAILCSEHGWNRKPMKPIFFAPSDIQPGELSAELQERLKASKNLIVICSPYSAQSDWVGMEIAFFHSLGRSENIHFFIVDGIPHSGNPDTECFNPVIKRLGMPEILGANINEKVFRFPWLNRERAYVQLITKLLGVEFDSIWQRHRRILYQKIVAWVVGIITVVIALIGVWINSQPVDVTVSLNEISTHNENLPSLKDAVVTMELFNESKTDTIESISSKTVFTNIPHNALNKIVHVTVACRDWMPIDTTFLLTENVVLNMSRNSHNYGDVIFRLWSIKQENGVANTQVKLAEQYARSDEKGYVRMFIPLERQSREYEVECECVLQNNILIMPTNEYTVLIVE